MMVRSRRSALGHHQLVGKRLLQAAHHVVHVRARGQADHHVVDLVVGPPQDLAGGVEAREGESGAEGDEARGEAHRVDAVAVHLAHAAEVEAAEHLPARVLEEHGVGQAEVLGLPGHDVERAPLRVRKLRPHEPHRLLPPAGSFSPAVPIRMGADQATPFTERATGTMFFGMVPSLPSRICVFLGVIQMSASTRSTYMVLRRRRPRKSAIWKFDRITANATPTRVPASLSLSCQSMDTPSRAMKRKL